MSDLNEETRDALLRAIKAIAEKAEKASPNQSAANEALGGAAKNLAEAWAWIVSPSQPH